jgi:nucleotide-binding universal stress UspA family protein
MTPERILLPLDIRKCPLEVFSVVNGLASHPGATVILLHVVTLNIAAPEKGVYEQLGRDAHWYLERLAGQCLRRGVTTSIRVRFGKPADEILAEAEDEGVDLIVLASKLPSFWRCLFAPIVPRIIERVVREATCGVFLTAAKRRFNCEDIWGRPGSRTDAVSGQLHGPLEGKSSPGLLTADALAAARGQHRVTASPGQFIPRTIRQQAVVAATGGRWGKRLVLGLRKGLYIFLMPFGIHLITTPGSLGLTSMHEKSRCVSAGTRDLLPGGA